MTKQFFIAALMALLLTVSTGAGAYDLRYPPVRWIADLDRGLQTLAPERHPYDPLDGFLHTSAQQMEALASATTGMGSGSKKHLPGLKAESFNTNNFEEVADSSWFTNRIGRYGITPGEIAAQHKGCGPDLSIPLVVREAADGSGQATLIVEDGSGTRFLLHLDPPDAPGKVSSAATAAAIILSTAGYNAAAHCPVSIEKGLLTIADQSQLMGKYGEFSALTREELDKLLAKKPPQMRAVSIRMPEGRPVGRFAFAGRRFIDKNDRLRHQDRRELRGLRLFSSFIGWVNISERSTYDVFALQPDGTGYVQHWFLNLTEISEPSGQPNPLGAGASLTNNAFSLMTALDAFWAARLIARFTDPVIDAIVAAAQYPDAAEAEKASAGLKARRQAIMKKWFGEQSPLDDFVISHESGMTRVTCLDLAVVAAGDAASARRYRARLATPFERATVVPWQESDSCAFAFNESPLATLADGRIYELELQARDAQDEWWLPAVKLLVRAEDNSLVLEGLKWGRP